MLCEIAGLIFLVWAAAQFWWMWRNRPKTRYIREKRKAQDAAEREWY